MAWSNPSNQSQSDLITTTIWNQNVVANPQFLYDNLGVLDAKLGHNELASAASFSFTNIPSSYDRLILMGVVRSTRAFTTDTLIIRFNNDSGGKYAKVHHRAVNASTTVNANTADTSVDASQLLIDGDTATANFFSHVLLIIYNYSSSSLFKPFYCRVSGCFQSTTTAVLGEASGLYKSTTAINRIDITAGTATTFVAESNVSIYGAQSI